MNTAVWSSALKSRLRSPMACVLIGALALRAYSAAMRCVINPDGAQYIFQASAIFNQQWSELMSCKIDYVSPLPLFIAMAFGLIRDWIVAGQAVNVLFGTAAIIPLYYLLKRFMDRTVCTLTILIYALMPVFVEGSGNIIRDPIFWFFSAMGMLMFVRQFDDADGGHFRSNLIFSCLFFTLATWARIEGIIFLMVSPAYLILSAPNKKLERLLFFVSPLALFGTLAILAASFSGNDLMTTMRLQNVFNEATQFLANLESLDSQIQAAYSQDKSLYNRFLHRTREILILIPLVSIFHNILEGIFYPFALIFFVGFFGLRRRYLQDRQMGYLLWLSLAGFIILYIHMIQTWVIAYRFLAVLIYPGCIIMANGMETILHKLIKIRQWPKTRAAYVAAVFLILFGLAKSIKPEESDKIVYRQAAQIIAQHRQTGQIERVYATNAGRAFEWALLYSHRHEPSLQCSMSRLIDIPNNYTEFIQNLDTVGARYFFYEKRRWPMDRFSLSAPLYENDLRIMGQWKHPDSDTAILFERITPQS